MAFNSIDIVLTGSHTKAVKSIDLASKALSGLGSALAGLDGVSNLTQLAKGLSALSEVPKISLSKTTGAAIASITESLSGVNSQTVSNATTLSEALKKLADLPKSNLGALASQLRSIPKSLQSLQNLNLDSIVPQINALVNAMQPLANVMQPIASGFSAMPKQLQTYVTQMQRAQGRGGSGRTGYNPNAGVFGLLRSNVAKVMALTYAYNRLSGAIGGAVAETNAFVENANLFDVAMGKSAESARDFANQINELMGVDVSEWMRSQGTFKMIGSGFGLDEETSSLMSQQLTQLSYDAASFYNIPIKDAIIDFQSAIAGELEPVRRLGFALDQATLQQHAYTLGIEQSITTMTQAEKSLLRYHALMSQNTQIQGDMARTLESPANAMRVFAQQVEQLKRAIGSIFIPIISKALPYLTAFVQLLRDGASYIASLLGFEMPKFDYSGIDVRPVVDTADAFEDIGNNADRAGQKVKEFKNYLLGFDEMHIIPENATDTTGGALGAGSSPLGGVGFDVPLETYDFLQGLERTTDQIKDKILNFLRPLERVVGLVGKVLGFVWEIRDFIIAGAIGLALFNVGSKIADIGDKLLGLPLGTTKTAFFGLASAVAGAFLAFEGSKDIATALYDDVEVPILGIIEVIAGLGLSIGGMALAFGPGGAVVGALVGLVAVIAGVGVAYDEMISKMVEETFYNDVGTKISDISVAWDEMVKTMFPVNEKILENHELMKESNSVIERSEQQVSEYATAWSNGAIEAEEAGIKIQSAMESILKETETTLSLARENIILSLGSSFGEALQVAGIPIADLMILIDSTKTETEKALSSVIEDLDALNKQYEAGQITSENYGVKLEELIGRYGELTGQSDIVKDATESLNDMLNRDINWESATARDQFFQDITNTYTTAKEGIESEGGALIDALTEFRDRITDPENKVYLDSIIEIAKQDRDTEIAQLDQEVYKLFDALGGKVIGRYQEFIDKGKQKFSEMHPFIQMFTHERAQINNTAKKLADEQLEPIFTGMENAMDEMGLDAVVKARETSTSILNALTDYTTTGGDRTYEVNYRYGIEEIEQGLKTELGNLGAAVEPVAHDKGRFVLGGMVRALEDTKPVSDAVEEVAKVIPETFDKVLDINSPSKVMTDEAKEVVNGVVEGLSDATKVVTETTTLANSIVTTFNSVITNSGLVSSFTSVASEIASVFNSMFSTISDNMNSTLSAMGDSALSFKMNVSGERRSYSYTPSTPYIRGFAKGGFPSAGELFLANEGGNPELVGRMGSKTAVANQSQIAEGFAMAIRPAIYDGVKSAMSETGGDTIVNIGGKTVARVTASEQRRMNQRAGKTVVTV